MCQKAFKVFVVIGLSNRNRVPVVSALAALGKAVSLVSQGRACCFSFGCQKGFGILAWVKVAAARIVSVFVSM